MNIKWKIRQKIATYKRDRWVRAGEKTRARDTAWLNLYRDVCRRHGVACDTRDETLWQMMQDITEQEFQVLWKQKGKRRK